MHIIVSTPTVTYSHRIAGISIAGGEVVIAVHTTSAEPISAPGGMRQEWDNTYRAPGSILPAWPADPELAVAEWLVSDDGPFTGGEIVSDEEFALVSARLDAARKVAGKRDAVEHGGCETPHGRIDTDPDSQRKISGAVVMAMLGGEAFTINWRLADNAIVSFDAEAMIAVGVAVGQHVAACQDRKNDLDGLIESAETLADLEAIDFDAGWPE